MATLQIILAMILAEICVQRRYPTQVLAQMIYPVEFPSAQGSNYPLYQSPLTYASGHSYSVPSSQLSKLLSNQMFSNQMLSNQMSPQMLSNQMSPQLSSSQLLSNQMFSNQMSPQMLSNQMSSQLLSNQASPQLLSNSISSQQLLVNHALNIRKQKLYRSFLLNRLLRQRGMITRESYNRNLDHLKEVYRALMKQQYYWERNTREYEWDKSTGQYPQFSSTSTPNQPPTQAPPQYQKFKINLSTPSQSPGGKTQLKLTQYIPRDIVPVMRSVPNPDSINNAIVNLAQSEPLREKVLTPHLRRPANSLESGETLDTLYERHKPPPRREKPTPFGATREKSHKKNSQRQWLEKNSHIRWAGFQTTQPAADSSEEVNRRISGSRVRHDERKKYSTKFSAAASTEVVEGELLPIQLQGAGPAFAKGGATHAHRHGMGGASEMGSEESLLLPDQNGNMHKIRDHMVPQELINFQGPVYVTPSTPSPTLGPSPVGPTEPEAQEMSRIADSLVSKFKQYQALQKLIHAEKPGKTPPAVNGPTSTSAPNYAGLLTFNLADYMQANTSPPTTSPSPLDNIRHSLQHKAPPPVGPLTYMGATRHRSPLETENSPVFGAATRHRTLLNTENSPGDTGQKTPLNGSHGGAGGGSQGGAGDEKIKELAQRIIAMKRSEMKETSTEPAKRKESEWTPLVTSAADHSQIRSAADQSQIRKNHRADSSPADQYVEIYTKDKLTRLSTHAKKKDVSIVYAQSADS